MFLFCKLEVKVIQLFWHFVSYRLIGGIIVEEAGIAGSKTDFVLSIYWRARGVCDCFQDQARADEPHTSRAAHRLSTAGLDVSLRDVNGESTASALDLRSQGACNAPRLVHETPYYQNV